MEEQAKRRQVSKFRGVYCRVSSVRRHLGRPDKCFDICYRDQRGKLVWEKVGWISEGYTAVMASQIRSERLRTIRHGADLPKQKGEEATFGEVWKRYDQWLNTGKKRPRDDRYCYHKHLKPRFANHLLSRISPFDLERLKIELTEKYLAPASVKHVLVLVRQIFNKAIAWGMWSGDNPVKMVKLPRLNNRRERFLNQEEAKLLLEELQKGSPQLHDMALLSLHTGMRAGEIFSLKRTHIDFENGLILVADPKGRPARKAFMTPTAKEMLLKLKAGEPEGYLFQSQVGGPIQSVSHAFERTVRRLGFNQGITDPRQKVIFHTLRHTFASWLAIQGTPILTIKELLGHQSLAMTERYAHLIPDQKRQAAEGIEKFLNADNKSEAKKGETNGTN
jgi:integrase